MIVEHNYIEYPSEYEIITDGRVLNALVKRLLINKWNKTHKYIDCYQFCRINVVYKKRLYVRKYFDGCFSPFVCKVKENNKKRGNNAK